MSHTARRLSPREDDGATVFPASTFRGRTRHRRRDVAMPSIPVRRLGSPEGTELRLADRLVDCCGCRDRWQARHQVPACPGKCAQSVEQQRKPRSRIARHSVRSSVLVWNAATRSRIGTTAGGYRGNQILRQGASGKRRKTWAGCPVKVRPFCASKQQKSPHFH